MLTNILKALMIGVCASAPLGPAAIVVLQKSLSYGHRAGFTTGLGVTTVDTSFAILSVFALAATQEFIDKYEFMIFLIGGLIVALLGISMAFKDPFRKLKASDENRGASIKDYFQALFTALSNPGSVAVMFALFAFFNVDVGESKGNLLPVFLGVAAGSMTYWYLFSWLFSKVRRAIDMKWMVWVNRVAGIIVMIIGISLLGEGAYKILLG